RPELLVNRIVAACAFVPVETGGPAQAASCELLPPSDHIEDRSGDFVDGGRIEVPCRVTADLRQRAGGGRRDRAAAGHRLDRWLAEALEEAWKDQGGGGLIKM